mmetsp:Transcript_56328/g.168639  ORF Transcript_56328/g.168639 Transcript_56328/m.168639 type:complete len:361 (-) Transcript_56328:37-1119(-)
MPLSSRVKLLFIYACSQAPNALAFTLHGSRSCFGENRTPGSISQILSHPASVECVLPNVRCRSVACFALAKNGESDGNVAKSIASHDANCVDSSRRRYLTVSSFAAGLINAPTIGNGLPVPGGGKLEQVVDPETYSALSYSPPGASGKLPLIVVLSGAGNNDRDAWDLADMTGEHRGLAPSLLASGRAPQELAQKFAVVAPYAAGRRSFYDEPRGRILQFIDWVCSEEGQQAGCPNVDKDRIFLFGFSDGATLGVELATSGRFRGGVFAAYGFTGKLPPLALERLKNLPVWVFHCADDVIFPVACSDRLVESLKMVNNKDVVKYTRYEKDQEGFTGSVKGHSSGLTSSKQPEIYSWMLAL